MHKNVTVVTDHTDISVHFVLRVPTLGRRTRLCLVKDGKLSR